ncbi:MAG: FKBP-type peptidyl-prolyl cis-trans isomerase, partial [Clostridia bacterium]|nr:FKBP-type peptidyl-prolyl cis-trans isomerase [Clostridia bacterium]
MKRIICLVLAVVMITAMFCGCAAKRELFDVNLSKHLTLADYKNIEVDKTATEYTDYRNYVFENYVANANAYEQVTTGTVADGDTVNINYTGKKDGVAFEGGTAENQFLVIGSKSFIDGFESGLIGKEVGSTVDLNLTFPSDYGATDLAGKAVVFTVKINYVQKMPEINDATAVKLGFETSDKLNEELDKQATNYIIVQYLTKNSSVDKYSKNDKAIFDKEYEDT